VFESRRDSCENGYESSSHGPNGTINGKSHMKSRSTTTSMFEKILTPTKATSSTLDITNTSYKGDTLLHQAIRRGDSIEEIRAFIKKVGNENAIKMARTVNDQGELPLSLCLNNKTDDDPLGYKTCKARAIDSPFPQIYSLLLPLTCVNPLSLRLTQPVEFSTLLETYKPTTDGALN